MNAHTRKTYEALVGTPAPRDLEWDKFEHLWSDIADEVKNESGDRLSVTMNGHREVFRRPHDGRVSIEDVERARHLLKAKPETQGEGQSLGHVIAVAIDEKNARVLDFDLDAVKVTDTEHDVRDHTAQGHHLRTVERHTGHDDEQDLVTYFDDLAKALQNDLQGRKFVVLGHGRGKSDAAAGFVERLDTKHHELYQQLAGTADVDLSAANDAELEHAALKAAQAE
ncbi:hypothetical protein [Pseudonocardia phyllosphaerae]|uniref:hypothetical protein n=1 Tax=Pseudonocardia phyllosphaerae TaxID=3390502 RepID=UPI003978DB1D